MATQTSTAASLFLVLNLFLYAFTATSDTPPSPNPSNEKCPIDALSVCANVINGLINIKLGKPQKEVCCALLGNLISLDAIVCLCTALKANILGINLLPVDLSLLLNHCGKEAPTGFQCMLNSNEQYNYSNYEDHYLQEIRMEEINNDGVERCNVVYDLSEADDFRSCHELDSDETDGDDDADDSDSTSTDNDKRDDIYISDANDTEGHIPTAPWFATEEITNNNVNDNLGDFSNINPLSDDLFEG